MVILSPLLYAFLFIVTTAIAVGISWSIEQTFDFLFVPLDVLEFAGLLVLVLITGVPIFKYASKISKNGKP